MVSHTAKKELFPDGIPSGFYTTSGVKTIQIYNLIIYKASFSLKLSYIISNNKLIHNIMANTSIEPSLMRAAVAEYMKAVNHYILLYIILINCLSLYYPQLISNLSQAHPYTISCSSPPYLRYGPCSSSTHARYLAATCALLVRLYTGHLPDNYRTYNGPGHRLISF